MDVPMFSLLDLTSTMTLLLRQLTNGVFDGVTYVIDQFLTGQEIMDVSWLTDPLLV
jgi:alcohol dehydrogenase YqhD (iron-dependent ADH family)